MAERQPSVRTTLSSASCHCGFWAGSGSLAGVPQGVCDLGYGKRSPDGFVGGE